MFGGMFVKIIMMLKVHSCRHHSIPIYIYIYIYIYILGNWGRWGLYTHTEIRKYAHACKTSQYSNSNRNVYCCLLCYTCTAILCLHSEVEGNSANVLSSWHCNVDTQFHLTISFTNCVYTPLKSHHHNCKKNSKYSSQFHKP